MMADEFGANRETIRQILVEDLGKRKFAFRFLPDALSVYQSHHLATTYISVLIVNYNL